MKSYFKLSLPVACLLLTYGLNTQAYTIDLPNAAEQNSGTSFVFRPNQGAIQWAVSSSLLSGLNLGEQIVGITFRQDGGSTTLLPTADLTFLNWNLQISQSTHAPGSLSSTFADNQGADLTTVRSGPMTINAESFLASPNPPSPAPWGPTIDFQTPYTYAGGDLLFTLMMNTGGSFSGVVVDAAGIDANNTSYQAFASLGFTATGGGAAGTPVFQLVIPEPTAVSLLGFSGLLFAAFRKK